MQMKLVTFVTAEFPKNATVFGIKNLINTLAQVLHISLIQAFIIKVTLQQGRFCNEGLISPQVSTDCTENSCVLSSENLIEITVTGVYFGAHTFGKNHSFTGLLQKTFHYIFL